MKDNINEEEFSFEDEIKNLEDFFITKKDKELYRFILESVEKPLIERVLEKTNGNQIQAAKILGINRNTLRTKIKKLNIPIWKWKR